MVRKDVFMTPVLSVNSEQFQEGRTETAKQFIWYEEVLPELYLLKVSQKSCSNPVGHWLAVP